MLTFHGLHTHAILTSLNLIWPYSVPRIKVPASAVIPWSHSYIYQPHDIIQIKPFSFSQYLSLPTGQTSEGPDMRVFGTTSIQQRTQCTVKETDLQEVSHTCKRSVWLTIKLLHTRSANHERVYMTVTSRRSRRFVHKKRKRYRLCVGNWTKKIFKLKNNLKD